MEGRVILGLTEAEGEGSGTDVNGMVGRVFLGLTEAEGEGRGTDVNGMVGPVMLVLPEDGGTGSCKPGLGVVAGMAILGLLGHGREGRGAALFCRLLFSSKFRLSEAGTYFFNCLRLTMFLTQPP